MPYVIIHCIFTDLMQGFFSCGERGTQTFIIISASDLLSMYKRRSLSQK